MATGLPITPRNVVPAAEPPTTAAGCNGKEKLHQVDGEDLMSWMASIDWVDMNLNDENEDAKRIDDVCALLDEDEDEDELTEEEGGRERVTPQSAALAVFQAFRPKPSSQQPIHVIPSPYTMMPARPSPPPSVLLQVSQMRPPQVMGYPRAPPSALAYTTAASLITRPPPRPSVVSTSRPAEGRQGLGRAVGGARGRSRGLGVRTKKEKWTEEENQALRDGVELFGTGKWFRIKQDPRFANVLRKRTNIDLKDRWRNFAGGRSKSARKLEKRGKSIAVGPAKITCGAHGEDFAAPRGRSRYSPY